MTRTCNHIIAIAPFAIMLMLGATACGKSQPNSSEQHSDRAPTDAVRWNLPKRLDEISGLASSSDGRLFAHNDERGIIYEIDWHRGRVVKAFALGEPTLADDFEGIAIADSDFYLVTSDGVLYRAAEGDDGAHVPYERIDTGAGRRCEIEGLAYDRQRNVLLLGCKTPRQAGMKDNVSVFAWSRERRAIDEQASFSVPQEHFTTPLGAKHFNPSSVEVSREGSRLYLLAGRQRALAEVELNGNVVAVTPLSAKRHRQPEGLTIGPEGELIIADEANGGRATLAVDRRL